LGNLAGQSFQSLKLSHFSRDFLNGISVSFLHTKRSEEHMMADHRRDAYSAFAEDHRELGAAKGPFSPTLRIKALTTAVLAGVLFWGAVIYFIMS